jgi:hypothetical protein
LEAAQKQQNWKECDAAGINEPISWITFHLLNDTLIEHNISAAIIRRPAQYDDLLNHCRGAP